MHERDDDGFWGEVVTEPEEQVVVQTTWVPDPREVERTRNRRRNGRHHPVRPQTINIRRETLTNRLHQRALYPDDGERRIPLTRAECESGPRPCPYVSCAYHLYLDVTEKGNIKLNFPHLEVSELKESCAMDIADRGGSTLEFVAEHMNMTRERVRQIEVKMIEVLRVVATKRGLYDYVDEGPGGRRRLHLPVVQAEEDEEDV